MIDITVTVIFHREGRYAIPALASMEELVLDARACGLKVEARAVLDNADEQTRRVISMRGAWLDGIDEVSFGDLGLTRNYGVCSAQGKFLAFLDGDDLWGRDWIRLAYRSATVSEVSEMAIWHPESLFYFSEEDFDNHSMTTKPNSSAKAFHLFHQSSCEADFDKNTLMLNNVWSANIFARRDIYLKFPYKAIDKKSGFGIEDWSWNIETVWSGVAHLVVPDTIHLIRVKDSGSLGLQNTAEGLLAHIPNWVSPDFSSV